MREESPEDQLHIQDFLSANCFGDHYTRSGLDIKTRELATFAMLISMGGCEPQVKGHIQGNINVGNNKEVLLDVVTQLLPYIGYPRTLNALRCLNEVDPPASQAECLRYHAASRVAKSEKLSNFTLSRCSDHET